MLPFVDRSPNGRRIFKDRDLILLNTIECLKATGMPLKEIKQYIDWCVEGSSTAQQRYDMFLERRQEAEKQIAQLQKTLITINNKCTYYEKVLETGTTEVEWNYIKVTITKYS